MKTTDILLIISMSLLIFAQTFRIYSNRKYNKWKKEVDDFNSRFEKGGKFKESFLQTEEGKIEKAKYDAYLERVILNRSITPSVSESNNNRHES